jgi:hypothetical protein
MPTPCGLTFEHDVRLLQEMLRLVTPVTPHNDAKLQTLVHWLHVGGDEFGPVAAEKCLIFTQYADTARYLYEQLNPDNDPRIEVIYSHARDKSQIVARFAPRANPALRPASNQPEIHLLIATDVLSEGLNLQDCDRLINYDLHWNPVRLIQRFGRIDRIDSEHDEVHCFNFLPETELERNLGLRETLRRRIQEIHNTLGEDAAILDPSEQLNEEAIYAIYQDGTVDRFEDDGEDDLVDLNEAEEIIRQLKESDPTLYERIAHLHDGIRCARRVGQRGTIVLCRAGAYRQLYLVDEAGEVISRDISSILAMLRCEPDTPAEPLPDGFNQAVMAVRDQFQAEVDARRAEHTHAVSLTHAQRYVLRELRLLRSESDDADLHAQIDWLAEAFCKPISEAVRAELNAARRAEITGYDLLDVLDRLYHRHNLGETRSNTAPDDLDHVIPVVVCSEGLIADRTA